MLISNFLLTWYLVYQSQCKPSRNSRSSSHKDTQYQFQNHIRWNPEFPVSWKLKNFVRRWSIPKDAWCRVFKYDTVYACNSKNPKTNIILFSKRFVWKFKQFDKIYRFLTIDFHCVFLFQTPEDVTHLTTVRSLVGL